MSVEITMPQLSDTMTEGTLLKWHKKEGDSVKEGDIIAEVETDKANMDMEAFESGTVALLAASEGEKVPVGGRMAVLASAGEDPGEVRKRFSSGTAPAPAGQPQAPAAQPKPAASALSGRGMGAQGASTHDTELGRTPIEEGRAQSRRETVQDVPEHTSEAISREAVAMVGKSRPPAAEAPRPTPAGEVTRRPTGASEQAMAMPMPATPVELEERIKVSPLARRIAAQMDVDLARVRGTGPGGRIVQRDILAAAKAAPVAVPVPAPAPAGAPAPAKPAAPAVSLAPRIGPGQTDIITLTKMRSVIAQRLQQSMQMIPHFYETIDIDVEEASQLRARLNKSLEKEGFRLSLADMLCKAVALALVSHPQLNATFDGQQITRHGDVNLGIAVALREGLIVPVLRGVHQMGLREIRARSVDLIERARAQKLRQEELSGATFTISNLGGYGIRQFTAIINPPEVAILAVGTAEKRPVVTADDTLVPRTILTVTLSADHRVVDGASAAEFLRTLKQLLEEPGMMLV
jgi:pyruvate dehydrogenase E2 component (dihydrolipoamide acetyltransferase)